MTTETEHTMELLTEARNHLEDALSLMRRVLNNRHPIAGLDHRHLAVTITQTEGAQLWLAHTHAGVAIGLINERSK